MDILSNLLLGFSHVLTVEILIYAVLGCALGMMTGVLPGFGPAAATALLLPLAFVVGPTASIVMIAAIYYGSMYGGTITSVLLNVPGETASVATCLDGYAMTKRGQAGRALSIAAIGSFVGGMVAFCGMVFATQFSQLALALGPPELFALSLLALTLVVGLAGRSVTKGLVAAILGLFVGTVGLDPTTGLPRFTMGIPDLMDGLDFVAMVMGLFGLAEILESIGRRRPVDFSSNVGSIRIRWTDIRECAGAMVRGTGIGFFFGLVPGSPAAACSFASYAAEKRASKTPELFGRGAIQGVAGPETANNALAISNFIPLLTLGIPSSATMAILLGALTVNGLQPGPLLFQQQPDVAWGLIASLVVSNVILLVMALPLVRMWVTVLRIPTLTLYAITLGIMTVGAYTLANSTFNVAVMWTAGLVGFVLRRLDVPLAPAALTLVLGPMLEDNFRLALSLQHGSIAGFFSPIAIAAYACMVVVVVAKVSGVIRRRVAGGAPDLDVGDQREKAPPSPAQTETSRGVRQ